MQISVIIPTYNREQFILQAIKSIQNQSIHVDEIIVVDDGSTDGTKELLKDEDILYIYQENRGVSFARNRGIKEAKHRWIAFLDSDDLWHKDKIQEHVSLHVNNPNLLASFSDEKWMKNGKIINKKKHLRKEEPTFLNSLRVCKIGTSTLFIDKSIFDDVGLFDESLSVCEDYDMWLRVLYRYEIRLIDKELITKRAGDHNQLSFNTPLIDAYRVKALQKHINSIYQKEVLQEIEYKSSILQSGAINRKKRAKKQ